MPLLLSPPLLRQDSQCVCMDLLMPVVIYDQKGHTLPQLYLFNQGDVAFLGSQHLPYASLALFFLLTFTLMPMLLLFLYSCSCFQVCLNRTGCSSLHAFVDVFQGHYKNGTNGTHDLRFFSGIYLLLRGGGLSDIQLCIHNCIHHCVHCTCSAIQEVHIHFA